MENKIKVRDGLKETIEANVKAWNTAYISKDFEGMTKAASATDEATKEYAEVVQAICFETIKNTGKPMLEAIKKLTYVTLKIKETHDKETNLITREVIERDQPIDLLKLDTFCKGGIAHDEQWQYKIERFNQLMCLRAARELKIDPTTVSDSYFVSQKARDIDMGKTPDSNTQILKLLQECVDAIIYEEGEHGNIYKATSKDVAALLMLYTKKGKKALSIATAKHSAMRGLIAETCHRIVTGKEYSLEYKQMKEKANTKESAKVA